MRRHAVQLQAEPAGADARRHVAMDGKTLRGSLAPVCEVINCIAIIAR